MGGPVGSVLLGLIALATPVPGRHGEPFFVALMPAAGWTTTDAVAAGWRAFLLTGVFIGAAFGYVVSGVTPLLFLTSRPHAVAVGVILGFMVWMFFFVPVVELYLPGWPGMITMNLGSLAGTPPLRRGDRARHLRARYPEVRRGK